MSNLNLLLNTKKLRGNSYLSLLTVTGISTGIIPLNQTFNGRNIATYSAIADVDDISVIIRAEANNGNITINGSPLINGEVFVNLSLGINTINIVVTPTDGGVVQWYSLVINRPSSPYLAGLDIKVGLVSSTLSWNPDFGTGFSRKIFAYTCTVTGDFKVMATLEDTGGPATMTLTVGAAAPVALSSDVQSARIGIVAGTTVTIKITVTSKVRGIVKEYIVDVSR